MAKVKLSQLPVAEAISGEELMAAVQGNVTVTIPVNEVNQKVINTLGEPEGVSLVGNATDKRVLASSAGATLIGYGANTVDAELFNLNKIKSNAADLAEMVDPEMGAALIGAKSEISGTVGRTQAQENSDRVSILRWTGDNIDGETSNQTAIQAAVNWCLANNRTLFWPKKSSNYISTSWIANFHSVKHEGDGILQRGSDIFYISLPADKTNTIYMSPSGGSANDGLTPDRPVRSFEQAGSRVKNWPDSLLSGQFRIKLLAGTYVEASEIREMPPTRLPILVEGTRDGTDAIVSVFNGTSVASAIAMNLPIADGKFVFKDIAGYGWHGSSTDGAVIQARWNCSVDIVDCYFHDNDNGAFFFDCRLRIFGGRFENNKYGIRASYQSNFTTYVSQTRPGERPHFSNNEFGAFTASRETIGHLDYCDISDGRSGIVLGEMSRVHIMGCDFKRLTVAADCDGSSEWLDDPSVTNNFNMGTADACTRIAIHNSGSREKRAHWQGHGELAYRTGLFTDLFTITGTTAVTQITSTNGGSTGLTGIFTTVTPYYFADDNKKLTVSLSGTLAGAGITKTLALYTNATVIHTFTTTEVGQFYIEWDLYAQAASQQRIAARMYIDGVAPQIKSVTTNLAISATAMNLNVRGSLSDGAGQIQVRRTECYTTG